MARHSRARGATLLLVALILCLAALVPPTATATRDFHPFVLETTPENEAAVTRAVALYNDARRATERGDLQRAVFLYEDAIAAYALLATAYNNLGMLVYEMTRDVDLASALLERGARAAASLGDNATLAATRNNMGFLLRDQSEQSVAHCLRAIELYEQALEAAPDFVDALYNKASALLALRQFRDVEPLLVRVLALDPHHVSAHMDMGRILYERGEIDRAVHHEDAIIASASTLRDTLGAMHNKGIFFKSADRLDEALRVNEEAVALAPHDAIALTDLVVGKRTLCLWDDRDTLLERMFHAVEAQLRDPDPMERSSALLPYDATLLDISDRTRKRLAETHARNHEQSTPLELLPLEPITVVGEHANRTRPLRVGFATYDFRDHPMGHLTLGLLDAHDPSRVRTYCYSYGANDGSEWRRRAERRCDVFRDGKALSDLEFARQIALDQVDVLVDLMAHTTGARLGLTSLRPSRLVVNYLGYPGTTGASFTNFVVADRFVVPPERAAASMTEQVVYLPHAYQVNEYDLEIAACRSDDVECVRTIRRAQGLPENAVVFCNLNTIDKMEPVSFGVWMNVLRRVPKSVLWLLMPPRAARARIKATLREEAQARGVDPKRLVFASREPKRQHLARLSAADVFLDSFVYNAHSTAADALWAHVPIVTVWGDAFPSRVAGSLIRNLVGLPELVPHSVKEYEDLAVQLAQHPQLRRQLRDELARQSIIAPLFDTQRITRHIETAYEAMHDVTHKLRPAGLSPQRFQILVAPSTTDELTPAAHSADLLRDAIARGLASQERGEWARAKAVYERVLGVAPRHSDAMHLLGLTLYQMGELDAAAAQLSRVVAIYDATPLFWYNRAVVLAELGRRDDADSDLRTALALLPSYSEAFFKLADMLLDTEDFEKLVALYERFGTTVLSTTSLAESERERGYVQFSFALAKVARTQDAIELLEEAVATHPKYFRAGFNLAAILSSEGSYGQADERQILTVEAEARHEFASRGHLHVKHARPRGRPVVAFYCHEYGQSWWDSWGPSSLGKGLGGSEEAVVFLSRELRKLGFWVEVYGDPPREDLADASTAAPVDGVPWYPHYAYDPDDRDVAFFVAWRYHISLAVGRHSKHKYFWVHDMPSEEAKHSRLLEELADGILCVSNYQASFLPRQLVSKLIVTSNALDPAYFVDNAHRSSFERSRRFVYGSSPSRGLFQLLQAWPHIRARVPDATLRVFYGFTPAFMAWGKGHIRDFDSWKQKMDSLLQQPGVEYVGLVNHETLANEYASAGFYLYPTTFSETSCVSLMKAMANGAIPITSRFPSSALSETTGPFDLGPHQLARNPSAFESQDWIDAWLERVVQVVTQVEDIDHLRQRMIQYARNRYQWAQVASEWRALFNTASV